MAILQGTEDIQRWNRSIAKRYSYTKSNLCPPHLVRLTGKQSFSLVKCKRCCYIFCLQMLGACHLFCFKWGVVVEFFSYFSRELAFSVHVCHLSPQSSCFLNLTSIRGAEWLEMCQILGEGVSEFEFALWLSRVKNHSWLFGVGKIY